MKSWRLAMTRVAGGIALAATVALPVLAQQPAVSGPTLDAIRQRGTLICGVNTGLAGFAQPDSQGVWRGFDVDYCRAVAVALPSSGAGTESQRAIVTVNGGYSPAIVRVKAGQPVRLVFDRQETSGCSEEVVFGDFGIRRFLPAHEQTVVEVTPPKAGTYEFTCGMGMLRGRLIAE